MFKYGYCQVKYLSCPEIDIKLSLPNKTAPPFNVRAIIDTGAVKSCIPINIVEQMGNENLDYRLIPIRGAIGKKEYRKAYILNLKLANCTFNDFEVIALTKDYAIIGRDILNKYKLILDGPHQSWKVDPTC